MGKNKQRRGRGGRKGGQVSLIAKWDNKIGGTTSLVVPYSGTLLSTGTLSFQSSLTQLWGGTSSVLYSVPVWGDYAALFTSGYLLEVRIRYTPHYTAAVSNGQGSGLAGFFQFGDLTAVAPASNMPSFRQACADARVFYPGRAYTGVWRPGKNLLLELPFAVKTTLAPGTYGYASWGYAFEQNPSVVTTQLGNIFFEFLVRFYRS
jgi:hypothetical protein